MDTKTGGIVIKLERPTKNIDNHDSEDMSDINADYTVNNDNTKMVLFYSLLNICGQIYEKAGKYETIINNI